MENELTMGFDQAFMLDKQIKLYANAAWQNLVESCKCLKQMKDSKGYESLGYKSFGEYTKDSLNIEERQAYTYISTIEKQGEAFLQSNANLGITKLALLNAIPATERAEFVAANDLAGMSVKEVKALVEENDHKAEQIDLLNDEITAEKENHCETQNALEAANDTIAELKAELEAERLKPMEVAVAEPDEEMINKIKADAAASAEKFAKKEIKAKEKEIAEKLNADKDKIIAAEKEKAQAEIESYKAKCDAADAARADAIKRAEDLEKKLAITSSPETTKFTFYFDALNSDYEKILESLSKIKAENSTVAEQYAKAMRNYHTTISAQFEKMGYKI